MAATHLELSDDQRSGFVRYFEGAEDLRVTLSDVDVLLDGDQALVTFTRHDVFHDRNSGKEVTLEVRLSSVVEQRDGHWLLRGVKKSSPEGGGAQLPCARRAPSGRWRRRRFQKCMKMSFTP